MAGEVWCLDEAEGCVQAATAAGAGLHETVVHLNASSMARVQSTGRRVPSFLRHARANRRARSAVTD